MKPYYQDEYITIYHGDCKVILPKLNGIQSSIIDPPYGIGKNNIVPFVRTERNSRGRVTSDFNWDEERAIEGVKLTVSISENCIVWGGNYYTDILPVSRGWLVWDKKNSGRYSDFEMAWTSIDMSSKIIRYMWNGMIKELPEKRYHVTQKPVAVMRWGIGQINNPGLICDSFAGSGSTLVAAKQLGLKAIGIELDEEYCAIAASRVSQTSVMFPEFQHNSKKTIPPNAQANLF